MPCQKLSSLRSLPKPCLLFFAGTCPGRSLRFCFLILSLTYIFHLLRLLCHSHGRKAFVTAGGTMGINASISQPLEHGEVLCALLDVAPVGQLLYQTSNFLRDYLRALSWHCCLHSSSLEKLPGVNSTTGLTDSTLQHFELA